MHFMYSSILSDADFCFASFLKSNCMPQRPRVIGGHGGPPPNPFPSMSMQFRPAVPPPQPPQPFVPVTPQQFQPVGHLNMGMPPPHPMAIQYPQGAPPPPTPLPPSQRPGLSGHGFPQGPPVPPTDFQSNRSLIPAPVQPQNSNNIMPNFGGPIISPVSFSLPSSAAGHQHVTAGSMPHPQSMPQTSIPNFVPGGHSCFPPGSQNSQSVIHFQQDVEQSTGGQPWFSTGNINLKSVTPSQQTGEQNFRHSQWFPSANQNVQPETPPHQVEEQNAGVEKISDPEPIKFFLSDWKEYTSRAGKKYYYNKRTKISSWEKPSELMTLTERADATTDWREFTSPEGRKYFFNKVTKQSKWVIPDVVKLARERTNVLSCERAPIIKDRDARVSAPISISGIQELFPFANNLTISTQQMVSSPALVEPTLNSESAVTSGSVSILEEVANSESGATGGQNPLESTTSMVALDASIPPDMTTSMSTPMNTSSSLSPRVAAQHSVSEASTGYMEEANKVAVNFGSGNSDASEGKKVEPGPLVYESKEEAKNAFKGLLETANVGIDWNWDQTMRIIINDRRYGALRTLGERKQVFNEFVGRKKKQEADERRAKQKKARDYFKRMLDESKDLTSSARWSKTVSLFENDERFHAIERAKDREDLFADHLEELKKKERAKASDERKRQKTGYLEFLKSCDFIKASSQWRRVQHRLEADERCSRLEKFERLEIFQEYIRDLELEEEEQRKLRMEELRKMERKNRDEFRKLMEEHVTNSVLTANTHWRDYCLKVKDEPAYLAVSSNTSGSTAKDLFGDVMDDLEKQYLEDKEKIEDVIKNEKISLSTNCTLEEFKTVLSKSIISLPISDINLKLAYDELMQITKGKEEKEAKKRKRLGEDFHDFLFTLKEITASSKWEDCKPHIAERFLGEESFFQGIFDNFIIELKGKAKEKERRRKEEKAKKEKNREDKERKNKERRSVSKKSRERHRKDETDSDDSKSYSLEENRKSREKNKKHRKRRTDSFEDASFDEDEKDRSKSHRHSIDTKKSKHIEKRSWNSDVDSESERKKLKRDSFDGSKKDADHKKHKFDEEAREDGEVR